MPGWVDVRTVAMSEDEECVSEAHPLICHHWPQWKCSWWLRISNDWQIHQHNHIVFGGFAPLTTQVGRVSVMIIATAIIWIHKSLSRIYIFCTVLFICMYISCAQIEPQEAPLDSKCSWLKGEMFLLKAFPSFVGDTVVKSYSPPQTQCSLVQDG